MLKIESGGHGDDGATLVLEGHLGGPWVDELRRACETLLASSPRLILDLGLVTFVDREGVELLRALAGGRAMVTNCSPFVAEQLRASER